MRSEAATKGVEVDESQPGPAERKRGRSPDRLGVVQLPKDSLRSPFDLRDSDGIAQSLPARSITHFLLPRVSSLASGYAAGSLREPLGRKNLGKKTALGAHSVRAE
ncbi:hypothetical protein GCM10028857_22210 [Salinarchaeum chitinilyticum]